MTFLRRVVAVVVALAVALALPLPGTTASHAATSLSVAPSNPVPRERIVLSGRFGSNVQRPVRLQYWTGSRWAVLDRSSTTSEGRFRFATRAVAPSRRFRVRAPRVTRRVDGRRRTFTAVTTESRRVRTVQPRARLSFVPAPVGQSKAGETMLTPGSARFTPVRRGRPVVLQRRSGGAWRAVVRSVQNRRGSFAFNVPARKNNGDLYRYRAVTRRANGAPAVKSRPERAVHFQRRFNDGFKGRSLNLRKWRYRQLGARNFDGDRKCSESSRKAVSVAKGKLRFRVRPIPRAQLSRSELRLNCPHGQFYNAHLGTDNKFSFRYGVMAARVKFHRQEGQHGGMWSQPSDPRYDPGNPAVSGAEIDAVEYFGDGFANGAVHNSIYWVGRDGATNKVGGYQDLRHLLGAGKTWSNSYHVYSVQWTPRKYIFRVDGRETFRTSRGLSKTRQYLILSLLTSGWELPKLDKSKLNPMKVDWVRVWRR